MFWCSDVVLLCFLVFSFFLSGKSTTLGILSGDVSPSQGGASIAGHDILTEQVMSHLSLFPASLCSSSERYCPTSHFPAKLHRSSEAWFNFVYFLVYQVKSCYTLKTR